MEIDFFPSNPDSAARRKAILTRIDGTPRMSLGYLNFGRDYFDSTVLDVGYHGYEYDGRFEEPASRMTEHYGLGQGFNILEVGCAKGFLLVALQHFGCDVTGIDLSQYAVWNAHPSVRDRIIVGSVHDLPFDNDSFDLVIAKEVLPHVSQQLVSQSIKEIQRVGKGKAFLEIQTGRTGKELADMKRWDGAHKTVRGPKWWRSQLAGAGYTGDVHFKVLFPEGSE